MTALTAGYTIAIAAMLFAAAVAVTIVVNVNGLDSTDEQPSHKETARISPLERTLATVD